jgi:hypothetical protein
MFEFTIAKFGDRKFIANDAAKYHNLSYRHLKSTNIIAHDLYYDRSTIHTYNEYINDQLESNSICIGDIAFISDFRRGSIYNHDINYAIVIIDSSGNKVFRLIKDIIPKISIGAVLHPLLDHNADFFDIINSIEGIHTNLRCNIHLQFKEIANKYKKYIASRRK